jgi:hypothetical protein
VLSPHITAHTSSLNANAHGLGELASSMVQYVRRESVFKQSDENNVLSVEPLPTNAKLLRLFQVLPSTAPSKENSSRLSHLAERRNRSS